MNLEGMEGTWEQEDMETPIGKNQIWNLLISKGTLFSSLSIHVYI